MFVIATDYVDRMRQWSIVRLSLAALLILVAWGMYAYWPQKPLLSLVNENMVGFDEVQRIFYTTKSGSGDEQLLRAYDLTTGTLINSRVLPCKPVIFKGNLGSWPYTVTGDGRYLLPMSQVLGVLPAVKLPGLEIASEAKLVEMGIDAFGLSSDGKILIMEDDKREPYKTDSYMLWDIEENQVIDRIELPLRMWTGTDGPVFNLLPSRNHDISQDKRYAAIQLADGAISVFDRKNRREVIRFEGEQRCPRFINEGRTLVLVPIARHDKDKSITWYQLKGETWVLERTSPLELSERETLTHVGAEYFVTEKTEDKPPEWYLKLPNAIQEWLAKFFSSSQLKTRIWDLRRAEVVHDLVHALPNSNAPGYRWNRGTCCSGSAKYIATQSGLIHVWATSPDHTGMCWMCVIVALVLAVWVGRPKRVVVGATSRLLARH